MNQPPPPPTQPPGPTIRQGVATGALELEKMRWRLVAWRLVALIIAVAIMVGLWSAGYILLAIGMFFIGLPLSIYLGGLAGLSSMR